MHLDKSKVESEDQPTPEKNSGFVFETEEERLLKDILRPPIEKLRLFTKMIRRNATLNKFHIK